MKRKMILIYNRNFLRRISRSDACRRKKTASENDVNLIRVVLERRIIQGIRIFPLEIVFSMIKKVKPDGIMFLGWTKYRLII